VRRRRALSSVLVVLVTSAIASACAPSEDEEVTDVCDDLRSLRATFDLLLEPPEGATVGEVRGALEKVAPVLARASAVDATDAAVDDGIDDAVEAFRDGLDGLGDDEPASLAKPRLTEARSRMHGAVDAATASLGCPD